VCVCVFLVLAYPGSPGQRAVKWVCVFGIQSEFLAMPCQYHISSDYLEVNTEFLVINSKLSLILIRIILC